MWYSHFTDPDNCFKITFFVLAAACAYYCYYKFDQIARRGTGMTNFEMLLSYGSGMAALFFGMMELGVLVTFDNAMRLLELFYLKGPLTAVNGWLQKAILFIAKAVG